MSFSIKNINDKLIVLADQLLVSGTNFLITILLSKKLGLSALGTFSLGFIVLLFCLSISQSFIVTPMLTLFAKQHNKKSYLQHLKHIQIFFTLATTSVLALIFFILKKFAFTLEISQVPYSILALICTYTLWDFTRKMCFVLQKNILVLGIDILVCITCLTLLFFFKTLSLEKAFLMMALANALCFFGWMFLPKASVDFKTFLGILKAHYTYSKWLVLSALSSWASGNIFMIIGAELVSTAAIGAIKIFQSLLGLLSVLLQALENQIPIKGALILQEMGRKAMMHYMKKVGLIVGSIFITILTIACLVKKPIALLLSDSEILHHLELFNWLAVFSVFVFIGTMLRFILRTIEVNKPIFMAQVINVLLGVCISIPLIRFFDAKGIILSMLIAQVILQGFLWHTIKKYNLC